MKILNIVYCYPPLLYPAVMCYLKLVKGLKDHGHEVEVVTVDPSSFCAPGYLYTDSTLEELVPPGVPEHRIASWESSWPVRAVKSNRVTHRLFHRFLEPRKREWTYPAIRRLRGMDLGRFDVILTCSQPHANHLIGYRLKRLTGKPWVAYFSDPWAGNIYSDSHSRAVGEFNRREESKVIGLADAVFFTSPEMLDFVMRPYPDRLRDKCGVLPHSFVPGWYDLAAREYPPDDGGKVRFVQTGHFYGPRTPLPLLRALAEIERRVGIPEGTEFVFHGDVQESARKFVRDNGLERHVRIGNTVPYIESLSTILRADMLFLVDAPLSNAAESVFLPSKLVDYLGSGRPIVGVTPSAGACARVLRETGNLVCDVSDEGDIRETFARILAGGPAGSMDRDAVDAYHYMTVTDTLLRVLKRF